MQISLNIKNESISQKILKFLSSFSNEEIEIKTIDNNNKNLFCEFSGMWSDKEIDLKSIRESAWKK